MIARIVMAVSLAVAGCALVLAERRVAEAEAWAETVEAEAELWVAKAVETR